MQVSEDLAGRLSQRLANYKLNDAVVERLADRLVIKGWEVGRFHPCMYGICIDYFTDDLPRPDELKDRGVVRWEVFPYGIIDWDRFRVRVAFEVDELEGVAPVRGFDG